METRFNNPIFVCGESSSSDGEPAMLSRKAVLLANLASNWAVRTHHNADGLDPRADKETLFRNIASSYVFLFLFNEETSLNAFYLNQLGIALARGVPVVGIREPSYIMPNPLPEHFYSTEVVDLTEARRSDGGRGRPSGQRGKAILANLLVELFRSAVVYTADFHKPCLERLFRKVTDAFARSEKERCFPPGGSTVTDYGRTPGKGAETGGQKVWTLAVGGLTKCPKCGSPVKTRRKTSVLRKTNSVDNILKKEATLRAASRQQRRDAPQLMITKSVLQPVVPLQPSFSKSVFQPGPRRPATSVVRQTATSKSAGSGETRVDPREDRGSRPTSTKSCDAIADNSPPSNEAKRVEIKRGDEGRSVVKETSNAKETFVRRKASSTTGFITSRRGAFLRKMSSLPCIPTTYLVTDPAGDAPAFVKYPPVGGHLSDDDANVPEFTDDEDKETIHISRRPSPAISTCSTNIE